MEETYRPVASADITRLELHHVDGWVAEAVRIYYIAAGLLIAAMVFWLLVCGQIGLGDFWWGAMFMLGPAALALGWVARSRGVRLVADDSGLRLDNSQVLPLVRPLASGWHVPWSDILRVDLREVQLDPKNSYFTTFEMRILTRSGKARRLRPIRWMPMDLIRTNPSAFTLRQLPVASTPLGQAFERFGPDIPMRTTV